MGIVGGVSCVLTAFFPLLGCRVSGLEVEGEDVGDEGEGEAGLVLGHHVARPLDRYEVEVVARVAALHFCRGGAAAVGGNRIFNRVATHRPFVIGISFVEHNGINKYVCVVCV